MNDETTKMLADLRTLLEQGGQFIANQAPPLAQEIILQGRIRWTFWLTLGLIAGLVGYVKVYRTWKTVGLWDDEGDHPRPQTVYLLPTVIGTLTACISFRLCVIAWVAPRLYVLEYVRHLLGDCQ